MFQLDEALTPCGGGGMEASEPSPNRQETEKAVWGVGEFAHNTDCFAG